MAEKYTDKTEYMAALRDKSRITAITSRVDVSDPAVAGELYKRLKDRPSYFESEVGRRFLQSLFVTSAAENRKKLPKGPDPENPEAPVKTRSTEPKHPEPLSAEKKKTPAKDRSGKTSAPVIKRNSKIRIEEGPKELADVYNSFEQGLIEQQRREDLDELLSGGRSYNEFWDGEPEEEETKPDRKKHLKRALIVMAAAATVILVVTAAKEISYRIENYRSKQKLAELQELVTKARLEENMKSNDIIPARAADPASSEDPGLTATPSPLPVVLDEYAEIYERNNDLVGWISIPDTVIDYPVMQTVDDMEYYLLRDFDGNDDKNGLPFVDSRSDVFGPSANVIIYGHSMNSGAMFAALLKFKDKSYYDAHKIIYFDTIYERAEYEIIACFQSRVAYVEEKVFRYYAFTDTDSPEEFDDFISNIKKMAYYDTGVTAKFGDSLITLSTCDREITNGRMVVVARKISKTE